MAPMGVIFGDICRWGREREGIPTKEEMQELKKELGNMIFSTIRWCDDLGFDPEDCINLAIKCQERYQDRKYGVEHLSRPSPQA